MVIFTLNFPWKRLWKHMSNEKKNWWFFRVYTLPKTNMDTQNDGLEKVTPFKMAVVGIYVRFLGCIGVEILPSYVGMKS